MPEKISAIISDIEGTIAPISFVAEKLFPYSRARLPDFLRAHRDDPNVAEALAQVGEPVESAIQTLLNWLDADRKETPLKTIQGLIWAEGYADGTLKGEIYPDAVEKLRAWKIAGVRLFIYSSGSVAAQKLLFGYSGAGDLTSLLEDYFDTKTGAKIDPASYTAILKNIALPAPAVLFLSDSEKELDAARSAGLRTACLAREGKVESSHPVHSDFTTLTI